MSDIFPALVGLVLIGLGAVFVVVSRPGVWHALDRISLELNPDRRWGKRRWPNIDAAAMRMKRPVLVILGAVVAGLGAAILAANLLS